MKLLKDTYHTIERTKQFLSASVTKLMEDSWRKDRHLKGHLWMTMHHPDGSETKIDLGDNLVVNSAGLLVAKLCKGPQGISPGISHMALGQGGPGENLLNPTRPSLTDSLMGGEYVRKPVSATQYVTSQGVPTVTETNIVDFITSFNRGEPTGPLIECGLFGGDNAQNPNAGTMFARRTFAVWNIDNQTAITFTWRIFF